MIKKKNLKKGVVGVILSALMLASSTMGVFAASERKFCD